MSNSGIVPNNKRIVNSYSLTYTPVGKIKSGRKLSANPAILADTPTYASKIEVKT